MLTLAKLTNMDIGPQDQFFSLSPHLCLRVVLFNTAIAWPSFCLTDGCGRDKQLPIDHLDSFPPKHMAVFLSPFASGCVSNENAICHLLA